LEPAPAHSPPRPGAHGQRHAALDRQQERGPAPRSMTGEPEQGRGQTRAGELPAVIHLPDLRQPTKKVTSGSENRQRTQAIRVRVHPADGERLKIEAAAAGTSVAGYLASGRLGDEAAPRPRIRRRAPVDVTALTQALVAFNRGTSLLNQTAHAANSMALMGGTLGAGRLADELRELRREIEQIKDSFAAPIAAILAALSHDSEG
jgi:hypothetical protein